MFVKINQSCGIGCWGLVVGFNFPFPIENSQLKFYHILARFSGARYMGSPGWMLKAL